MIPKRYQCEMPAKPSRAGLSKYYQPLSAPGKQRKRRLRLQINTFVPTTSIHVLLEVLTTKPYLQGKAGL